MKKLIITGLAALVLCVCNMQPVHAGVIDYADVDGLSTFQDTSTGWIWLDMDNFFNEEATVGTTGYDMIQIAQEAGFQFATQSEVESLLNTLPLNGGQWSSYAAVMGYGVPRQLIWGMFDDGDGNPYGWAWAYATDTGWNYNWNCTDANLVQNSGSPGSVDMGIWAYRTDYSASVPEPSLIALLSLALGFSGILALYQRKK